MKKTSVSVVIPAFNEEKNIEHVLKFFASLSCVSEVIVVDDASTDNTKTIAKKYASVFKNKENLGKTKSVRKGIEYANEDVILLADADLLGLDKEIINEAIKEMKQADTVLIDYGAQTWWIRNLVCALPGETGLRLIKKKDFKKVTFPERNGWELEPVLNRWHIKNNKKIACINMPSLHSPYKHEKYNFFKGMSMHLPALVKILTALGFTKIFRVWADWIILKRKLKQSI